MLVVVPAPSPAAPPRLERDALSCFSCLLIDDTGRALFARRARAPLPNASTTKMATALVVVGAAGAGEVVSVSRRAADTAGGGLALEPGDTSSVEDLLHALLLSSSNDAAVALAEHVSGTEEAFVARMNEQMASLGAGATKFVTSHGLDAPGHVSTARDLAVIGAAVLDHPLLAEIVARPRTAITVSGRREELANRNPLVETYPGTVGIKTGFTAGAGNVLVAAARRNGRTLVAVSMRADDPAGDDRAMLDYGFALLARTVLLDVERPVAALVFPAGATGVLPVRRVRGPVRSEDVAVAFAAGARAPVVAGEVVGEIVVSSPGGEAGRVEAVATDTVGDADLPWPITALAGVVRAAASLVGRS